MLLFRTLSLCLVCLTFTGCGFTPLYKQGKSAPHVQEMSQIHILSIPNRSGQILRNDLVHKVTPYGRQFPTKYRLAVQIQEKDRNRGFRTDSTASSSEKTIIARFQLIDVKTGKQAYNGKVFAVASYSMKGKAQFATLSTEAAKSTAQKDALTYIATQIQMRLATYLKKKQAAHEK